MVGPIPAGWINCPNAGTVVGDTFLAFKTPLRSEFDCRMSKDRRWNPQSVFRYSKELNIRIGLWIDLTNTERYFNKSDVEKQGIKYVKLKIGGGGEVPSALAVQEFISHCQTFLTENPNGVIGVHCTHGFNRTGFLICSFLAKVRRKCIQEAFSEFCKSRPPGIYRQGYVAALWKIFKTPELSLVPTVEEPLWSQRHQQSGGNHAREESSTNYRSGAPTKRQATVSGSYPLSTKRAKTSHEIQHPQFFDAVPGIEFVDNIWLRDQVLFDVRRMCLKCAGSVRPTPSYFNEFPGRRGRELLQEDLEVLDSNYVVTWTGETSTQYLLLIKNVDQVFFIDSACTVFHVNRMTFPDKKNPRTAHLMDTLLDGEVMLSKYKDKLVARFYVQDIINFSGKPVTQLNHTERMSLIKKEILDPRLSCLNNGIILRRKESELWLTQQPFWSIDKTPEILQTGFCNSDPIGLKFLFKHDPYKPQALGYMFHWKKSSRIVNFRVEVNTRRGIVDLFVLELVSPFTWVPLQRKVKECDGRIGKFAFDSKHSQWQFVEEAETHIPGSYADAISVLSLRNQENVTEENLLTSIQNNLNTSSSKTLV